MLAAAGCQPATPPASPDQSLEDTNTTAAVQTPPAAATPVEQSGQTGKSRTQTAPVALRSVSIELGSPELTSGIPGSGELTVEEIKAWLAKEENHVPIDPLLPLGLDAGRANMFIPEDNPMTRAKIELGRQLYFDPRLSADSTVSCASCHHPDEGYGRKTQFGVGIRDQQGNRNSPVSYNRILSGAQFWDGRAASLEDQAVGPIANPIEMGSTHEAAVAAIQGIEGYRLQFESIFPDDGVTIENIGKAIATFERAIVTSPAPYDYYELVRRVESAYGEDEIEFLREDDPELYARYQVAKQKTADLSEAAILGRELFFSDRAGCTACHAGANFTDEKYHNLGVGMDAESPDLGRFEQTGDEKDKGAFKTPTIRNVALSPPYMHDGSQQTLQEVVEWYNKGGHPNPYLSDKIKPLNLTEVESQALVAFMEEMLTSDFAPVESARLP
jgi:cytochrome c peroxidase